ncbi:hypothetical protein RXV90_25370 [Rhodophyticola sp. MJ-SS7]|nr:hypothetical protein [Rhodophyticola sp. MJ-SS7]
MVRVNRPEPTFRRNDPLQQALRHELQDYSNQQLQALEAAMEEYLTTGLIGPTLAHLFHFQATHGNHAA